MNLCLGSSVNSTGTTGGQEIAKLRNIRGAAKTSTYVHEIPSRSGIPL